MNNPWNKFKDYLVRKILRKALSKCGIFVNPRDITVKKYSGDSIEFIAGGSRYVYNSAAQELTKIKINIK